MTLRHGQAVALMVLAALLLYLGWTHRKETRP
ncbi:hypothetical protein Tsedi_00277 [Tepidimonas sediminis]|uniref:Uncharacterized protein n=1 Tax=Tepidimonas sediminis TaxID=2588941 RepID=A0A554WV32_9BURK|nr:hypothetical protein Tsedi_00277 [Tepidimonas sediminis]